MTMRVRHAYAGQKDCFGTVIKIFEWIDNRWIRAQKHTEQKLFKQIPAKSHRLQYIVNWDEGSSYSAHYARFLEIASPTNLKSIW